MGTECVLVDQHGKPLKANGHSKPRPELIEAMLANQAPRRARASYDAARDTVEYANHWANSDALDADSSNSRTVRHKLIRRSRYECGSNGYYAGIIGTHVNMVVGVGPTLRMLTGSKVFNQLVERSFYAWAQRVSLADKLWCMEHAKTQDGEAFAILQTNPEIFDDVQLDIQLIEAEQVQTPHVPFREKGHIDGIKFDKYNNIAWYDVLPQHPGNANQSAMNQTPVRVLPRDMLHWFKLERPGQHRGTPSMTSTLNVGASSRRFREATEAAAETAADLNVVLTTQLTPDAVTDPMAPFSSMPLQKRMMTAAPSGWDLSHLKSEHPSTTYPDFIRSQISEMGRPLHVPANAALMDSSTYSFASGKLDTLCQRAAIDVERKSFGSKVLDVIFAAWFREWTILIGRRDIPPEHQWDWPAHPVIDVVAEATARDTKLKNGTLSMRDAATEDSKDYEDELRIQAEDYFGNSDDASVEKMRTINILRNTPQHAMPFVAEILGVQAAAPSTQPQEAA